MSFSLFVLVLYVFLQSAVGFGWFSVDPKFLAFVGLVFCIAAIIEGVLWVKGSHPAWLRRTGP